MRKPIAAVTEADFRRFPLWRYTMDERADEDGTAAVPILFPLARRVANYPTLDLAAIAAELRLADGTRVFGLVKGATGVPKLDRHIVGLSAFVNGVRCDLAGYHVIDDTDPERRGLTPEDFAHILGRDVEQAFPIAFDLSAHFSGPMERWRGQIFAKPPPLTNREELRQLMIAVLDGASKAIERIQTAPTEPNP